MLTPEARQLRVYLRNRAHDYRVSEGSKGGNESGFMTYVGGDYDKEPKKYPIKDVLMIAARDAWGPPTPWERRAEEEECDDLFSTGGIILPRALTIPDPAAPRTNFRQVATVVAPIVAVREDAIITMTQGARISQRGLEKMRSYHSLLEAADGDPQRLIIKHAEKYKRAA